MDTLLILRDTITVPVVRVIDSCQPSFQEAEANKYDESIANTICDNLFWIVFVCVVGFLLWKIADNLFQRWKDCRQHKWDVDKLKWKQRADLIGKLLDFLKDRATDNKEQPAKNGSSSLNPESSKMSENYICAICGLIDILQKDLFDSGKKTEGHSGSGKKSEDDKSK